MLPRCRFDGDWANANPIAENTELIRLGNCYRLLHTAGRRAVFDGNVELAVNAD